MKECMKNQENSPLGIKILLVYNGCLLYTSKMQGEILWNVLGQSEIASLSVRDSFFG